MDTTVCVIDGYHAPWLDEVVGEINPRMAALQPDVVLRSLLFQLRAFVNAGFRAIAVITGHNGAQADPRLVATEFMKIVPVPVVVQSDPELVAGTFPGDHAGRFELSQLMYCRPELVDLDRNPPGQPCKHNAAPGSATDQWQVDAWKRSTSSAVGQPDCGMVRTMTRRSGRPGGPTP
jgi:creatinine amidohydrolase/Fe(II)-dependent formamide hydrolase-like protein